jgi:serine/threonine protein kinase
VAKKGSNMDSLRGRTIGQYQILEEIGRGGMAVVYRAYQPSLNRFVAIKVLPPQLAFDRQFVERFRREAQAAAGLRHPHIVVIYDVGHQDGLYYIAMEYLEGHSLKELVEQGGPLDPARAARMVEQIASALDYAHRQGFVHRDVKPANIFVGKGDHVTLTDFGIAKAASGTQLTQAGMLMGTPEYMSPEQAQGQEIDPRTDVYALAVVAYQMLSGRVPFGGTTPHAVLYKHVHELPPPLRSVRPGLPHLLEAVLDRGLAKDPRARYPSAGAFAGALTQATTGRVSGRGAQPPSRVVVPPATPPVSGVSSPERPARPAPPRQARAGLPAWLWALAGLAAVVLVVVVVLIVAGGGKDESPALPQSVEPTAAISLTAAALLTATSHPPATALPPSTTPTVPPTLTPSPTPTATPSHAEREQQLLGQVQWRSGNGTPVFAYYTHQPPALDGILDEWTGNEYAVNYVVYKPENWQGAADLSARFYIAWDHNFLYLGLDVDDDQHVQAATGKDLYQGDDVEIQIDADLLGDLSQVELSDDDGQVGLAVKDLLSGQYEAYIWRPPSREGPLNVSLAARPISNPAGYVLEVALPWSALNLSPRVETPYGFCLSLADTDTPGLQEQQGMVSSAPERKWGDPTTWGTLILVDW